MQFPLRTFSELLLQRLFWLRDRVNRYLYGAFILHMLYNYQMWNITKSKT